MIFKSPLCTCTIFTSPVMMCQAELMLKVEEEQEHVSGLIFRRSMSWHWNVYILFPLERSILNKLTHIFVIQLDLSKMHLRSDWGQLRSSIRYINWFTWIRINIKSEAQRETTCGKLFFFNLKNERLKYHWLSYWFFNFQIFI